jgi:hypothetical protein
MPAIAMRVNRAIIGSIMAGALLVVGHAVQADPIVNFDVTVLGGTNPFNTNFNQTGLVTGTPGVHNLNAVNSIHPTGLGVANEWEISGWDFNADDDPGGLSPGAFLGAGFTLANNMADGTGPLHFTITLNMNTLPAGQPTLFFGSGGMTLNIDDSPSGQAGELKSFGNGSVWTYRVNGADGPSLFGPAYTLGGNDGPDTDGDSANLSALQTAPLAGMSPTSIGIRLDFTLSAGESATFNGAWGYIPAPGAIGLLALAGMAGRGRRRLA